MVQVKYSKYIYWYVVLLSISCIFLAHVSSAFHHTMIAILLVIGLMLGKDKLIRKFSPRSYFITRFVFVIWALLSYLWANYYDEFFNRILVYTYSSIIILIFFTIVDDEKYLQVFFKTARLSGLLLSFYILYHSGFHLLQLDRLKNEAMSINTAATKFAYIALMQLISFRRGNKKSDLIWFIYFAIMIVFTGSKTAFLMVFVSSIVFYTNCYSSSNKKLAKGKGIILGLLLAIVMFAIVIYIPAFYKIFGRRILQLIEIGLGRTSVKQSLSTYQRSNLIQLAWDGFLNKPVTGWGENNFIHYNEYRFHAHSSVMEILFDFGSVGFILFFYQYYYLIKLLFRHKKRNIWIYIAISIIIASLIEVTTSLSHKDLLNWLMLAMAYKYIEIGFEKVERRVVG